MSSSAAIRFFYDGEIVEITGCDPTATVLDWLREQMRKTGTKEGCAEGDCGACTVIVAELADTAVGTTAPATQAVRVGDLALRPMNACIKFLPTLDGCALLTVEDVAKIGATGSGELHPVQQAMVERHGSQCGFCTPGFIMTMTATYEKHCEAGTTPTRKELSDDLAGNLCRCTGYRPILEAGARMFELPVRRLDTKPIEAALRSIRETGGRYEGGAAHYWSPTTVEDFAERREIFPDARLLAGATDIGLWVNKQMRDLGDIIYIGGVEELKRIEVGDGVLNIGAAASLEDAFSALVAQWPTLDEVYRRFASPPVRHAGTLGGNVANGSPIGDGPPVLLALGASLVLRRGPAERIVSLDRFYLDYMKNDLQRGEFVKQIEVPLPVPGQDVRVYKVSKRFDSDITSICAALSFVRGDDGVITDVRFAYGGMAATARRAAGAEAAVLGTRWTEDDLRRAQAAINDDFTPLTDLRASAEYRKIVAANLLERFWLETRCGQYTPLPAAQTSVYEMARQ
jgi:xanthine dehydrogenase small subunit